jgi:hypothetical protein
MMTDHLLQTIRDIIQEDVNQRGLRTDPALNLITAFPDDFAAACRSIAQTPQAVVGVVTGFFIPTADPPAGETDGPLGALFLARALTPLGIRVVLLTDAFCTPALATGIGMSGLRKTVALVTLPPASQFATLSPQTYWETIADRTGPLTHLIALERAGPSHTVQSLAPLGPDAVERFHREVSAEHHDRCHTMRGLDITERMSPAHLLFESDARRAAGVTTIGIGDGGNEIGCGVIKEAVREIQPFGKDCGCPCHGGVGTVTECDVLVFAAVSNWGAYGIAAALAGHLGDRDVLHDEATELRIVHASVAGGAMDGAYSRLIPYVDGTSDRVQASLITLLHQIVENGLKEYDRGF